MKSSHIVLIFTDYIRIFLILATILKILIYCFFLNQEIKIQTMHTSSMNITLIFILFLISILKTPAFLLIKSVK